MSKAARTRKCMSIWCLVVMMVWSQALAVAEIAVAHPDARLGRVCGSARPGNVRCDAIYLEPASFPTPEKIYATHPLRPWSAKPVAGAHAYPPGNRPPYGPVNIDTAYNLPQMSTHPAKIAVITAYDDPNAESDLAYYRTIFGLGACTTVNGCFLKVNQTGNTGPYPAPDAGWAQETSLDLDMVSAVCRNCQILLVEASSTSIADLGAGVNTAVRMGATVVTNSYGTSSEFASETDVCNTYYSHPNVAITASTGDSGLAVQIPAACPGVIAVGGTSLPSTGNETAWGSSGGGCSQYIPKPSWQSYVASGCNMRAAADVSALADPNTGFYVYDTYQANGFYQVGGTSAAAPLIAGIYGLAGNASSYPIPAIYLWIYRYANVGCFFNIPNNSTTAFSYQGGLGSPNTMNCF
jgi:Predicted protease